MRHDVIIVGGSYSGMAAALQLLRAHRDVLVIDAGLRRNRFAAHSHGFLAQDGVDPAEIVRTARGQLETYPTLTWKQATAVAAAGAEDRFAVTADDGAVHHARRLLFAIGVSDALPDIDGLAERWGRSVFHCPYCHGYELNKGRIGVIATGPVSLHQAQLLPEWGQVTFFTNGLDILDGPGRDKLTARGVTLDERPIARLSGKADVTLSDGDCLPFAGLFTVSRNAPGTAIAQTLGCALADTPFGVQVQTDERKETNIPGAFACGDAAKVPHSVALAVGDGAWAGASLHQSLVF